MTVLWTHFLIELLVSFSFLDIELRKEGYEIAVKALIVPMLNELRKVDEMV